MEHATHTASIERLIQRLSRFPGVGRRSAERMAYHLLKASADEALELAAAISEVKRSVLPCSVCSNFSESDPCPICSDPRRDQGQILVVEQPKDVLSIETTSLYRGVYHVLMGRLAPLDGVGPGELTISLLLDRIRRAADTGAPIREVILGTSPNLEGDGTALFLSQQLESLGVAVTRLARGLPAGYSMEHASKNVLADALHGRIPVR